MARRASSGVNLNALLGGAAALIIAIGVGYWFLNRKPEGFKAEMANVGQYRENQNALVGNRVQASGTLIDRRNEGDARMITLKVEENGESRFLPIIIPPDLQQMNLNIRQDYSFLLEFDNDGIAVAAGIKAL